MMINQNSAVHFYGQRPMLPHQLPAHYTGQDLGAISESAGKIFMPGSAGAAAIGGIVDKFGKLGLEVLKTGFPLLGQVVEIVGDVVDFILTPVGNLIEAMAVGSATYLEMAQAQIILDDMNKNWDDYARDAFCDWLYAFYRRIGESSNKVVNIKEGRSGAVQAALGFLIDKMDIGRNSNRVAYRIYTKAVDAGAKDWQAAAAVCYGLLTGLQTKGFPAGKTFKVAGIEAVKIGGGPDTGKALWPLGNDFDAVYFSKLGPKSPDWHSVAWVQKQYLAKSGGAIGGTEKDVAKGGGGGSAAKGGGALPLLLVGALAYFASK